MKTAILAAAILATSSTAFSFQMNHAHEDWQWGSEMNDNGAFIASTSSKDGYFQFIVVPESGQCTKGYSVHHFFNASDDIKSGKVETFDGIPIMYRVDRRTSWTGKETVIIAEHDDHSTVSFHIATEPELTLEILKGRRLYTATGHDFKEGPATEDTFSLMGSTVAMRAVYGRCMEHLAAFPNYRASKDSRNATLGKQAQKAQQAVADKVNSI